MLKFRSSILALLSTSLLFAMAYAQGPPTEFVPQFSLTTNPPAFRKGQPVTLTAHMTVPGMCTNHSGLILRNYAIDNTTGEPTFETKYLAQSITNQTLEPKGAKIDLTFEPLDIPAAAGEKIYIVLWNWCEIRIPHINPEDGTLIWESKVSGRSVGGSTFHSECGKPPFGLCLYKPD